MCLSIPAEIISIEGDMAKVSIGGTIVNASLQLIENPTKGEYVLVHSGFAIEKISKEEADSTLKLFKELGDIEDLLNSETT
ncbi:MAG TPA: HypC/HybG/HupF family hydrogenase formation chaperone [Bacteroidales bacterium]|nr:HypC/HybG/HupF family hydrogenase formation chaperone [Bacteroidales bacterium]HQI46105.1 HypC/HybG/HupF family hydrogenase formation chaperone [Bacteroidales bacterium]